MTEKIAFQFDGKLDYQREAVSSVAELFRGMNKKTEGLYGKEQEFPGDPGESSYKNRRLCTEAQLLANLQQVQRKHRLFPDETLGGDYNFTVEMETGTGKTYVYLRTILELYREYGFRKFMIVVPSIAIRKGVEKSSVLLREHFRALYGLDLLKHSFVYDGANPRRIQTELVESQDLCICIMNIQSFNKNTNRIRTEDESGTVLWEEIQSIRPILVLDEPQRMEGESGKKSKSLRALEELHPLFTLRYSATHKNLHHPIYKLDSYEAYRRNLVKEIQVKTVRAVIPKDFPYIRYRAFTSDLKADVELFCQRADGQSALKTVSVRGNTSLYELSGGMAVYQNMRIAGDPHRLKPLTVETPSGPLYLPEGHSNYEVDPETAVRIQIRLAIENHFEKQLSILKAGKRIKALTLFFIDSVERVRDSGRADGRGVYLRIFDEEYEKAASRYASAFQEYEELFPGLFDTLSVREGYFAVDQKNRAVEVAEEGHIRAKTKEDIDRGISLILEKKEELISFSSPLAFIFSHSALREGWDNPNVFTLCTLKAGGSEIAKKQEIGRGLRLPVDMDGNRCLDPGINELTVIANDYYDHFASALQADFNSSINFNPKEVTMETLFASLLAAGVPKDRVTEEGVSVWRQDMVRAGLLSGENIFISDKEGWQDEIEKTLKSNPAFCAHAKAIAAALGEQMGKRRSRTISIKNGDQGMVENGFQPYMRGKLFLKCRQTLCAILSRRTLYQVRMDKEAFVRLCRARINERLESRGMKQAYRIETGRGAYAASGVFQMGKENEQIFSEDISSGQKDANSSDSFDLHAESGLEMLNAIMYHTTLPRRTVFQILRGIRRKELLGSRENLEDIIQLLRKLLAEEKASHVVRYDIIPGCVQNTEDMLAPVPICREDQTKPYRVFIPKKKKAMHRYYRMETKREYEFAERLEEDTAVFFYAKLAENRFSIETPYGDCQPTWVIACQGKEAGKEEWYFVEWMNRSKEEGAANMRTACARLHLKAIQEAEGMDSIFLIRVDCYEAFENQRKAGKNF